MNRIGEPVRGPAVWTREELSRDRSWIRPLAREEADELVSAVHDAERRGCELLELSPERFPLPRLAPRLAEIAGELENGRGMVQLRGLPVERLSPDQRKAMLWGLGTYLGVGLSQSKKGDYLGEVTDLSV